MDRKKRQCPCISVLGTGSDVGKSVITTALCRIFSDRGLKVAPFKAQNMSNNSGVTPEGLEMGRAQIVQAEAARVPPHVDMNPILLKPTTDVGSQVVVLGRPVGNATAVDYHKNKKRFFKTAKEALFRLRLEHDLVIMEGAGSCAEVNLLDHDIVNLVMAKEAGAPAILVGDIHRGGIFAQLVGTLTCLKPADAGIIAGFIVNRFRGDISIFKDGIKWIESKTKRPVFGVLPWFSDFHIEAEDSVVIENIPKAPPKERIPPAIAVIRIPHISNFTDFDPLRAVPGLNLYFVEQPEELSWAAAVILPGSKNTRFDLKWLHKTGWTDRISGYASKGGHILGICGGYQMLGRVVHDPDGTEGPPGRTEGLDLLPVETILEPTKVTTVSEFSWEGIQGVGYEIHMGRTRVLGGKALFRIKRRNKERVDETDGTSIWDGRILGTYIHGLFDTTQVLKKWLDQVGLKNLEPPRDIGQEYRDRAYCLLAQHFISHVNMEKIDGLINRGT